MGRDDPRGVGGSWRASAYACKCGTDRRACSTDFVASQWAPSFTHRDRVSYASCVMMTLVGSRPAQRSARQRHASTQGATSCHDDVAGGGTARALMMICSGRKDHLPVRCPPQRREARSEARGKGPTCRKRVRGGGSGLRLRGVVVAGIVLSRGGRGGAMRAGGGWPPTWVPARHTAVYCTVQYVCTVRCRAIKSESPNLPSIYLLVSGPLRMSSDLPRRLGAMARGCAAGLMASVAVPVLPAHPPSRVGKFLDRMGARGSGERGGGWKGAASCCGLGARPHHPIYVSLVPSGSVPTCRCGPAAVQPTASRLGAQGAGRDTSVRGPARAED